MIASRLASGMIDEVEKNMAMGNPRGGHMPLKPSTASEWPYNPLSTWFIPVNIVPFVLNRHSAMRQEATTVAVSAVARLTSAICHSGHRRRRAGTEKDDCFDFTLSSLLPSFREALSADRVGEVNVLEEH